MQSWAEANFYDFRNTEWLQQCKLQRCNNRIVVDRGTIREVVRHNVRCTGIILKLAKFYAHVDFFYRHGRPGGTSPPNLFFATPSPKILQIPFQHAAFILPCICIMHCNISIAVRQICYPRKNVASFTWCGGADHSRIKH